MWTYIQELSGDPAQVIQEALEDKTLAPRKNPTEQTLSNVVFKLVKSRAIDFAFQSLHAAARVVFDDFYSLNGDYDDLPEDRRDDYSSALDDIAEAMLEPYDNHISADWYGKMTIDTRLWESLAEHKWLKSAAAEIFKQMTYGKTPIQVLSSAGITMDAMRTALTTRAPQQKETDMTDITTLEGVAAQIASTVGKGYDVMELDSNITKAQSADVNEAYAAGARIGLTPAATEVMQMGFITHGDALTDEVVKLVDAALAAEKPKPAKRKRSKAGDPPPADAVPTRVMEVIKAHSSAKDNDVAEGVLKVSRGTWNSYVKGKAHFVPEGEQVNDLRKLILADVNPLLEAIALLDGTEPTVVH